MKAAPALVVYVAVFLFRLPADTCPISLARLVGWGLGDGDDELHHVIPHVVTGIIRS